MSIAKGIKSTVGAIISIMKGVQYSESRITERAETRAMMY